MTEIHGDVAAGFEPVRDAFAKNFAEDGEVGAAVCLYRHGVPVVDLWAGVADPAQEIGFGYVMNQMQLGLTGDPRAARLVEAVYTALDRASID